MTPSRGTKSGTAALGLLRQLLVPARPKSGGCLVELGDDRSTAIVACTW